MKKQLGSIIAGMIICLVIIISSCMKMDNKSDGDWIKVSLDLQKPQSSVAGANLSVVNTAGNYAYPSILITAVKGTVSAVSITSNLAENYGQMLLKSDNTVSLTLPVGDSVRLVRAHYANDPTLQQILDGSLIPMSISISEPFTVDANTTRKSIQVVMPSMSFNLSKDSYVKGVFKVSMTGSKAFDPNYWGWRDSGYLEDTDHGFNTYADVNHFYFLENDNKTISWIKTIDNPLYPGFAGDAYQESARPFADGSFAGKMASTDSYLPMRVTTGTQQDVDLNGTAAAGYPTFSWTTTYDSSTGYPTTQIFKLLDSATNSPYAGSITDCGGLKTFSGMIRIIPFSPRSGSANTSLTNDGYTIQDVNGTTQCVYNRTWSGVHTLTDMNFTETKATYDSDGSTLLAWMDPLEGQSGAARWERTNVLSENVVTETSKWYDVNGNEFYRTVSTDTITNVPLRHRSASSSKGYNVSNGVATLVYQDDYTYVNNMRASHILYNVSGGIASASLITTITRDAQGRFKTGLVTDGSGTAIAERSDSFESSGRRSGNREYQYINGQKTPACTAYFVSFGSNWDLSYSTDTSGNMTFTGTSYCNWSAGQPGTYQATPYYRFVRTYNTMGQMIDQKTYQDITSSGNLSYVGRKSWTFDVNGALTKIQYYNVDPVSSVDTASYYSMIESDSNLYRTATKNYDEDGDLSNCSDAVTNSCTTNKAGYKCTSGTPCYQQMSYTYY